MSQPVATPGSSRQWRDLRSRWTQRLPYPCRRCGDLVQPWEPWDLDHEPPRARGGRDEDARPSHRSCNRAAGLALGRELAVERRRAALDEAIFSDARLDSEHTQIPKIPPRPNSPRDSDEDEPSAPDPTDPVWDRCEWLDDLRVVPASASWPRLMSGPHPDAVGSYGAEAIEWLASEADLRLRWWQRLAITRALEHDADGDLVWLEIDLSTPRQVGKSVTVRGMATWRIHQAERFGEPQLVLHTGKDLPVCKEVMRPARIWARARGGYGVKEANGAEEISIGESRWIVRARFSVYGYAVSVGLVDECWRVDPEIVEDGVEPTQGDQSNPQLWLVSTAHRRATSLFPLRRTTAISQISEPGSSLLLEWSASRETAIDDRAAWRAASPHWTKQRERLLEAKLNRVQSGVSEDPDEDDPVESFRAQYLNVWPIRRLVTAGEGPLVDAATWAAACDVSVSIPSGPIVVGVEDWYGRAAAACAVASLPGGRFLVWGEEFPDREAALAWTSWLTSGRDDSSIVVGASIPIDSVRDAVPDLEVAKATTTDLKTGLPLLRVLLRQGRLVHGGQTSLDTQLAAARVAERDGGLVMPLRTSRVDLVRALAWAVQAATSGSAARVPRPAIY